jgi:hypothetical protein
VVLWNLLCRIILGSREPDPLFWTVMFDIIMIDDRPTITGEAPGRHPSIIRLNLY